ncbi:unnamed protein product [Lactuca saligna]|uniref:Uncharacterized protein n=1 Tax=Lactuca saligna TaxID=75948 RepID=A0AA35Z5K1_LACSI|nr:unnamed protein product [Lactuca saligna]
MLPGSQQSRNPILSIHATSSTVTMSDQQSCCLALDSRATQFLLTLVLPIFFNSCVARFPATSGDSRSKEQPHSSTLGSLIAQLSLHCPAPSSLAACFSTESLEEVTPVVTTANDGVMHHVASYFGPGRTHRLSAAMPHSAKFSTFALSLLASQPDSVIAASSAYEYPCLDFSARLRQAPPARFSILALSCLASPPNSILAARSACKVQNPCLESPGFLSRLHHSGKLHLQG